LLRKDPCQKSAGVTYFAITAFTIKKEAVSKAASFYYQGNFSDLKIGKISLTPF